MVRDREAKNRRLAAIVFTDIVGYSALVNRDEAAGVQALDVQRRVVRRCLASFGGREVETAGDSFLLTFGSAFAALRCVAAIHRQLEAVCSERRIDPPVRLRASLHLGDIAHRGREIFGDGVNVAARILPLSPVGGVAMSDQAHAQVRHRLDTVAESLGPRELKNIRHPVEVFVLDADTVRAIPAGDGRQGLSERRESPRPRQWSAPMLAGAVLLILGLLILGWQTLPQLRDTGAPLRTAEAHRIAVLPFATFSTGNGDDMLAAGLQDSILTSLAQLPALRVISRTSVSAYDPKTRPKVSEIADALHVNTLLEGSLQRIGNRVLVQAQLIDGATDHHLWAQSYERNVDDLFQVESEISQQVATAVNLRLSQVEREKLQHVPAAKPQSYALYLQARQTIDTEGTAAALEGAEAKLNAVVAESPDFAPAHVQLARLHLCHYLYNLDHSEARVEKARAEVMLAQALAPDTAEVHVAWGSYYLHGVGDLAAAAAEYREAVRIDPNLASALAALSDVNARRGNLDDALMAANRAIDLDPRGIDNYLQAYAVLELMRDFKAAENLYQRLVDARIAQADWLKQLRMRLSLIEGDVVAASALVDKDTAPAVLKQLAYYRGDIAEVLKQVERQGDWQDLGAGYPKEAAIATYAWMSGDASRASKAAGVAADRLREVLKKPDSRSWELQGVLAICEAIQGHEQAALALLQQARKRKDVEEPEALTALFTNEIGTYAVLGRGADALNSLREMMRLPVSISPQLMLHDPVLAKLDGEHRVAAESILRQAVAAGPLRPTSSSLAHAGFAR